jgi:peptide-methionine (S)-S-oxide reductase
MKNIVYPTMIKYILLALFLTGSALALTFIGGDKPLKATSNQIGMKKGSAKASFGAGCFWGVEAEFRQTKGVTATMVGYIGGRTKNPTYKEVCADETGHAEAVQVEYDPNEVTYTQLLQTFWDNHNPTTPNRQGPDYGSQYRSVIFYHTEAQKAEAIKSRDALAASGKWKSPIVTEIVAAKEFYPAEDYHQQYLEKRGLSSCHTK